MQEYVNVRYLAEFELSTKRNFEKNYFSMESSIRRRQIKAYAQIKLLSRATKFTFIGGIGVIRYDPTHCRLDSHW